MCASVKFTRVYCLCHACFTLVHVKNEVTLLAIYSTLICCKDFHLGILEASGIRSHMKKALLPFLFHYWFAQLWLVSYR